MKQIIDNKIYDTEKAIKIFEYRHKWSWESSLLPCYYNEWEDAEIFKTNKDNYFIYYHQLGFDRDRIEVIQVEQVKTLIKDLNPDKYLELFGNIGIEEA